MKSDLVSQPARGEAYALNWEPAGKIGKPCPSASETTIRDARMRRRYFSMTRKEGKPAHASDPQVVSPTSSLPNRGPSLRIATAKTSRLAPTTMGELNGQLFHELQATICRHQYKPSYGENSGEDCCSSTEADEDNFWVIMKNASLGSHEHLYEKAALIQETVDVANRFLQTQRNSNLRHRGTQQIPPSTPTDTSRKSSSSERLGSSGKRKRFSRGDLLGFTEEDSPSENDEPQTKGIKPEPVSPGRRFACPYFKRCPQKYQSERTCLGPGWTRVHRIKEHIYRKHKLPQFTCQRCGLDCLTHSALTQHSRLEPPCLLSDIARPDGIDIEQENLMKSRKKNNTQISEPEKWNNLYRILFPLDDHLNTPSPYHEYSEVLISGGDESGPSPSLAQSFSHYEEFLLKELPKNLRTELDNALEVELDMTNQVFKDRTISVLQKLSRRMLRLYMENESLPSHQPHIDISQEPLSHIMQDGGLPTGGVSAEDISGVGPVSQCPSKEHVFVSDENLPPSSNIFNIVSDTVQDKKDLGIENVTGYEQTFERDWVDLSEISVEPSVGVTDNGCGHTGLGTIGGPAMDWTIHVDIEESGYDFVNMDFSEGTAHEADFS